MAIDNWLNLDLIVANKKEADNSAEQNSTFSIFFWFMGRLSSGELQLSGKRIGGLVACIALQKFCRMTIGWKSLQQTPDSCRILNKIVWAAYKPAWNPGESEAWLGLRKVVLAELVGQCVWVLFAWGLGGKGRFKWFETLPGMVFAFIVILIQVDSTRTSVTTAKPWLHTEGLQIW